MDEHKIHLKELYGRLRSSPSGLTSQEAATRLQEHGPNFLITSPKKSLIIKFVKELFNFFSILLTFAAVLSLLADYYSPNEGYFHIAIALIAVVIFNAFFTFLQKYRSEKIMASFQRMLPQNVEVLRDHKRQTILAYFLVPGDIIFLSAGQKVPADARLIEQNPLKVDHSSITGEAEPQLRSLECTHEDILQSRNVVFSGTLVQSGDGKAVVYETGSNTQIGKIVSLTKETASTTSPLHREINHFITLISGIAIVLGILFFLIGYNIHLTLIGSFIFGIGIIVANVPEGLLPTVTLSLSLASKRIAKKNALIRNLESVETLGSTTVICTDKTGTLTENKMTLNTIFLNGKEQQTFSSEELFPLLKTMLLCNNAHYDNHKKSFFGDPTEVALLEFAKIHSIMKKITTTEPRLHELPFDSKTKRMISINRCGAKKIAYLKGAPEVVLQKSSQLLHNNKTRLLTTKQKETINNMYKRMASRGERVLAFAYKEISSANLKEENFIFIGLAGIIDPPRPEVPDAIAKCKTAGIKVIMITGDHSITAEVIARKIGLIHGKANILTGDELDAMDEPSLCSFLKKNNLIFSRTNPTHKLRIVKALQSMNEIVTVTGDGINDAPALKNADMGVAMGKSGTEVAREASDMILMDDNFATIINAIEEGRTIYNNIKRFISYILASNMPEIIPFIVFALFNIPLALTVVLILSIDLGTDMLPAIGLGAEKPEFDVMNQKPRSPAERLLTKHLLFNSYLYIGMIQVMAGFFAFFYILYTHGWTFGSSPDPQTHLEAITGFFVAVVVCQMANVLTRRTSHQSLWNVGLFSNKLILWGILVEIVLIGIIVYLPFTQPFFGTQPLSLIELLLGVPFAILILLLEELRKYALRNNVKFVQRYLSW